MGPRFHLREMDWECVILACPDALDAIAEECTAQMASVEVRKGTISGRGH